MNLNFYINENKEVISMIGEENLDIEVGGVKYKLLKAGVVDAAREKHVPYVVVDNDVLKIQIGEVIHPMTIEHHIAFIVVEAGDKITQIDLDPTGVPYTEYNLDGYKGIINVYEYCNLHGLWKKELTI